MSVSFVSMSGSALFVCRWLWRQCVAVSSVCVLVAVPYFRDGGGGVFVCGWRWRFCVYVVVGVCVWVAVASVCVAVLCCCVYRCQ